MRRFAYRYSEARASHWLMLVAADRVDSVESSLQSMFTRHPDNPITETGVLSEFSHHGVASRRGQRRADGKHQILDPIIVGAPWAIRAGIAYLGVKAVASRIRGRASSPPVPDSSPPVPDSSPPVPASSAPIPGVEVDGQTGLEDSNNGNGHEWSADQRLRQHSEEAGTS
jgi:hypothetical protein